MLRKEWSLIVYSLMLQAAVGIVFFLLVFRLIFAGESGAGQMTSQTMNPLTSRTMGLTGLLILAGMAVSVFHLGNPFRAYRSVTNLSKSWLSREIFFTSAFFVLWAAGFLMEKYGNLSFLLIWLTLGAGVLVILSMARIYYSTGKTGWHSATTFLDFFGTPVIFGTLVSAVMLYGQRRTDGVENLLIIFSILSLFIVIARFSMQLKLVEKCLSSQEEYSMDQLVGASLPARDIIPLYRKMMIRGFFCTFAGCSLILLMMMIRIFDSGHLLIVFPAVLVVAGEISSRSSFYLIGSDES
ncbi:MAG: dimethyl sulfoxide reductase anchor subunit [Proteobacteria bacterium]|nr:dimethyl sulfoxide reductase anchor subunit [Pseudomonadota bacterium]MBU1387317.1 dimethyl sulfoxide reductase anchor subunit [Pseudomonadota bacterium]MBU1544299.1 dimethyl sulfoxide reductase anchor subunit [Pseudomonadota bacterium]MBU2480260.1 dimethyl sulfoxide reductase anchor subunit [Pseudomonadota bacterium]